MDTILYVDDEPINLVIFKASFKYKFNVLTAESGFQGLEILAQNPDVKFVVSDMKMPQMDGIEFITQVKDKYPQIKCFILTGFSITEEISSAIDAGLVTSYFRKPFNRAEIESAMI